MEIGLSPIKMPNKLKKFLYILFVFFILNNNLIAQDSIVPKLKIGLVLSGGGAFGLAHIGVLKVLEEYGIKPDFIGGTSMGSIVGGLYAIGYDAKYLQELFTNQNWNDLLNDRISIRKLSYDEKADYDRFAIKLPIDKRKIRLPSGIKSGQNISLMLSRLAFHVHNVSEFSKFPIPYLCIATDIESGLAIVLKNGYLPDAIRASMAIPTIFTPVEIDGHLLVDGGLVNNFPVEEVKKMGADFIIGVDVGHTPFTKKDMQSLYKIFNQFVFFHSQENSDKGKLLSNIYIHPYLKKYNVTSFNEGDSIIARGEKAAREMIPELLIKLDSLGIIRKPFTLKPVPKPDSIYVEEIVYEGLEQVPLELLESKLGLFAGQNVSLDEINEAIDRAYGSQYFSKISFKTVSLQKGEKLIIRVEENTTTLLRVGIHYDSDFNAGLLINGTLRNKFIHGSKLSINLQLSENPSFLARYYISTSKKVDYGASVKASFLKAFTYKGNEKVGQYNYFESSLDIFVQIAPNNSFTSGYGIQAEISAMNNIINPFNQSNINNYFINEYLFANFDSYDRNIYPRKGLKFLTEAKIIMQINKPGGYDLENVPAIFIVNRLNKIFQIDENLSFNIGYEGGITFGDTIPVAYHFYVGGIGGNYWKGLLTFPGMRLMQGVGKNAFILKAGAQYEVFRNNFVMLKMAYGTFNDELKDFGLLRNYHFGIGATYGFNSIIGPMEITFMNSNYHNWKNFMVYLNLGFWF